MQTFPLMIPGADAGTQHSTVTAPYDGAPIAEVTLADAAAVERALANGYALHRDRDAWLPAWRRVEILQRTASLMAERAEMLALEAAREGGKPLVDSKVEVARAIDGVHLCAEELRSQHGQELPMGITPSSSSRLAFTRLEPIGLVVAVSAFNHPLNLIVHQVAPAVAAGCPCIIKPAGDTPLSCLRFVEILREAGLPDQWCQAVQPESRALSEALATDSRVAFFSFIGSAAVGWGLRSKLAPGARCALEHGGVAPVIVAEDADVDRAVPLLAKGGFYHAGQVCVSVQRVFAHASIARSLAERLAEAAGRLRVGDPTDATTEVGPLIRPVEVDRVEGWVTEAVAAGAEAITGGRRISDTCYAPTLLYDPPADAKVSTQEVFGPVVCVYPFEDIDDALARANSLDVSFQAAVFTRSLDTTLRVYRRIDASAVMVNDHTAFRVDWMPFAGLRQSGHGIGGIPHTLHDMQIEKMLVVHSDEL